MQPCPVILWAELKQSPPRKVGEDVGTAFGPPIDDVQVHLALVQQARQHPCCGQFPSLQSPRVVDYACLTAAVSSGAHCNEFGVKGRISVLAGCTEIPAQTVTSHRWVPHSDGKGTALAWRPGARRQAWGTQSLSRRCMRTWAARPHACGWLATSIATHTGCLRSADRRGRCRCCRESGLAGSFGSQQAGGQCCPMPPLPPPPEEASHPCEAHSQRHWNAPGRRPLLGGLSALNAAHRALELLVKSGRIELGFTVLLHELQHAVKRRVELL
mmetsp:Transcript_76675/g.248202  ORF Transcript_76675/g.248202 Transcript_76675/m.248202 type:complete len:271 (+) Transcript_76675:118-930(+)